MINVGSKGTISPKKNIDNTCRSEHSQESDEPIDMSKDPSKRFRSLEELSEYNEKLRVQKLEQLKEKINQ